MRRLLNRARKDTAAVAAGSVELSGDYDTQDILLGDSNILRSIITNLLSNAVRFTPKSGHIDIVWKRDDNGSGVIEVHDSGIGIAPEDLARVTERFYRTDSGRARHDGGSGIGSTACPSIRRGLKSKAPSIRAACSAACFPTPESSPAPMLH